MERTWASTTDSIRKQIHLDAPRSRVWRALTDFEEFSEWFGVSVNDPFEVGATVGGEATLEECGHITFEMWIERMEPERVFALRWNPGPPDPDADYSDEPTTLVEFRLEDAGDGTRLTLTESGFDALPAHRRDPAFRSNDEGWSVQMDNIRKHVDG